MTLKLRPALLLLPLLLVACAEEPRFGVVDVQLAFQRSPLVMVSAHEIKADLGGAKRELKNRGRALAERHRQLAHGALELDDAQRAQAEAQVAEETASLMAAQARYRAQLEAAQRRRGEELIDRVEDVAREVAEQAGLTLLLLRDGALYTADGTRYTGASAAPEHVDLTERVARTLLQRINPTEIPETRAAPDQRAPERRAGP